MAQGSGFWKWYAEVNDDIRHHMIDKHRGQAARDPAMAQDVDAMARRSPSDGHSFATPSVETPRHGPEALHGIGTRVNEENAENVKSTMEQFYGRNQRAEPDAAAIDRFYGRDPNAQQTPDPAADREREAAMKRFYGHHQYEPQELDDHTGRLARDAEIQKQMDERDGRER